VLDALTNCQEELHQAHGASWNSGTFMEAYQMRIKL